MIWVDHRPCREDPEYADIIIDGHKFNVNIDELGWIRDMCIDPAIRMLERKEA